MSYRVYKRIFAVLTAVLLGAALSVPQVFADTAAAGDSSTAETFFNELQADNGIGRTLFIAGAVCVVLGAGGIVGLIIWQRTGKNRDRSEADRAEVLDEIAQEERRNRKRREEERMRREREEETRVQQPAFDPNQVTGDIPVIRYTGERPIMPETPVSMQPHQVRRPTPPQRTAAPKAAANPAPAPSAPKAPVKPAPAPKPEAKPAPAKPAAAPEKYDLEDILREVREMNANK